MSRIALNNAQNSMGGALAHFESVADMRGLTPLPKDAQELVDNAVVEVGLERLTVVKSVIDAGLVYNLPNPMGVMELYSEKLNKAGHAIRTMIPGARGEYQNLDRTGHRVPIYATTDDFTLNVRALMASRRSGAPLDTSHIKQATRRVNESIEDAMIFGATGLQVNGNTVPGILTAPNSNAITFVDGESWTHVNHSGEDILADVLSLVDALEADNKFGPYTLYVPTAYGNKLNEDFKSNSDKTIRKRLEELDVGGAKLKIVVADRFSDDTVALVQMTSDVVELIVGQQPTVVSWTDGPKWNHFFTVLAFAIPRVRDDYDGQSGIVVGTPT